MNLDGKVAIITGSGGKGTGRAVARRFAQEGMAVVVSDTNHTGGDETVALIAADRGRAAFHPADVKNENEIITVMDKRRQELLESLERMNPTIAELTAAVDPAP